MKNKGIMALALASVLTVSALTTSVFAAPSYDGNTETTVQETQRCHKKRGGKQEAAEPENAIGKDAAKAKALADAGLTEEQVEKVKAHVSQLDDGTVVYKVRFVCDGQRYSYQINATTGAVEDKSIKTVTEDELAEHHGHGRHARKRADKTANFNSEAESTSA